jgi:hypothetical protein
LSGPLKRPYKAVIEVKNVQIKANIFEPSLGNDNNKQNEAKVEDALL